ncbi:MAG: hypothetical protein JW771_05655 [Candidatus Thermoplasmatota archaeon]|nr:hypothetical protein [Candidatus Thermoplasmatota archaeon]
MKRTYHPRENASQMIILMGILLALSIFVISSLAADIINLDIAISNERATSTVSEFNYVKESFGTALNYNLLTDISNNEEVLTFTGTINAISDAFTQTKDQFRLVELTYGNLLDATLNSYWYSHLENENYVYYADVSLTFNDGKTTISENITYSIICQPG